MNDQQVLDELELGARLKRCAIVIASGADP
jgi:hypothetical protein